MLQQARQLLNLLALAGVNQERGPAELGFAGGVQLRKNRNQLHGQVVDAVEAHVLKGLEHGALAGAGKPGQDDELACISFLGSLRLGAPVHAQAFSRRWWVLGMRMSSRYLATGRRVT